MRKLQFSIFKKGKLYASGSYVNNESSLFNQIFKGLFAQRHGFKIKEAGLAVAQRANMKSGLYFYLVDDNEGITGLTQGAGRICLNDFRTVFFYASLEVIKYFADFINTLIRNKSLCICFRAQRYFVPNVSQFTNAALFGHFINLHG